MRAMYDLKLLFDLVWANRNGQVDFFVPHGFGAAARRLWIRGYISTQNGRVPRAGFRIQPTTSCDGLVRGMLIQWAHLEPPESRAARENPMRKVKP